jgi:predicted AlkP superfamily pyrophosphatase or phosphodiesterase
VPGLRRLKRILFESYDQWDASQRKRIQQEASRFAAHAPPAHIPLAMLPYIGVSEDNRPIHLPGALDRESIFDVFSERGIDYKFLMFPLFNCDDEAVTNLFLAESETSAQVILGQFSDSDLFVHHCGPSSQKRRAITGEIDRRLREIALQFGNDVTWVIIGDHGMTDVHREIDIAAALEEIEKRSHVRRGSDYLMFLDSTMARFYFRNDRGRRFLETIKETSIFPENGKFIDDRIAQEYQIPISDRRYGDLIWWADIGTLIFPDYFHDRHTHNKGMHGYDSEHDDMKGFFLSMGPGIPAKVIEECHLIDVCASLCAALGIRLPSGNLGRSLIPVYQC